MTALWLLSGLAPQAVAQGAAPGGGRSAECIARASRAAPSRDPATVTLDTKQEVTFSLELPAVKAVQCATTVEVEYTQRDTNVSVEGTLDHKDCAASNEYPIGENVDLVSVRARQLRCSCAAAAAE